MEELKLKVVCVHIMKASRINTLDFEISDGNRPTDMRISMLSKVYKRQKESGNLENYIRNKIRDKIKIEFIGGIE